MHRSPSRAVAFPAGITSPFPVGVASRFLQTASSFASRSSVIRGCFVKLFFLLDLPIPAGGQIIFVGLHLIFGDPKLAGELVDLRLKWHDAGLEFRQVRPSAFSRVTRALSGVFETTSSNFRRWMMAMVFQTILLQWGNLLLQVGESLGALLLEFRISPMIPAFQHVGDVVFRNLLALVI